MKKIIAILCVVCLGLVLFISGCTQQKNNEGTAAAKTVTMTAKELAMDEVRSGDETTITSEYKSLNEGDTLIINDMIFDISYYSNLDKTVVSFIVSSGDVIPISIIFDGNITDSYQIDDNVSITTKIKHITGTDVSQNGTSYQYNFEFFEGSSEFSYFFNSSLPITSITEII